MGGLEAVLATLPYGAGGTLVFLAVRLAVSSRKVAAAGDLRLADADKRYRDEVADHERTQAALDEERQRRRKAEDDLGHMVAEIRVLKEHVQRLERQVAVLTEQIHG